MKPQISSNRTGVRKKEAQWELQDESPGAFSLPKPGGGVGEGGGSSLRTTQEEGTAPLPPPTPPTAPPDPAEELAKAEIREWLEWAHLGAVNYLVRTYPAARLWEAIDDFEAATPPRGHFIPRDRTAYFRSLLK
jgi:hypothetical protein